MSIQAATATKLFQALFADRAVTPDLPSTFETSRTKPWSQGNWQAAACYVLLSNTQEVSSALNVIKETGCRFAIRSAEHNPNRGFNNADESGVVLDLSNLRSRELSADKEIAYIGAGNQWGEIYAWLEGEGRCIVGGRCAEVGMGFLLGGGYPALPNLYGLGSDNVVNLEVVLPDSRIVNANSSENTDLFRALKGGGSNFGIVTRFDIKTHPILDLQYSIKLYRPDDYVAINKATIKMQEEMEAEPRIGVFTNFNPQFGAVGLVCANATGIEYDELESKLSAALPDPIMIPVPKTEGSQSSLTKVMAHPGGPQKRYVGTLSTKYSEDLYEDVYLAWQKSLPKIPDGVVLHYTIQPLGAACVEKSDSHGGNVLGLEICAQCWWVFSCEWPDQGFDSSDTEARSALDSLVEGAQESARSKGLLLNYLTSNFASAGQAVLQSYGAENLKLMQAAAQKYDPDGMFQKQQWGGFLLRDLPGVEA
ncbi:FAD-binding oxidoreductase [Aspergillus stella-maris]|uniref:FAD-binding oxidoreductase n=1 Tax=Aspergillus stella-maris TaxID=1810926 RepID=UPI003CCD79A5